MPPPSSGRSAGAEGRYTVVYEGDPSGVRILSGEPAPGKAVGVMTGDVIAEMSQRDRRLTDENAGLIAALKAAQSALAMLTEPQAIRTTRVHEAWAVAVDAELKCRLALAEGRPASSGET